MTTFKFIGAPLFCASIAASLLLSTSAFAQAYGPRAKHAGAKIERSIAPVAVEKSETTIRDMPPKPLIRLPGNERPPVRLASLDIQALEWAEPSQASTSLCREHHLGPRNTIERCL
jgi:hypothetical protein